MRIVLTKGRHLPTMASMLESSKIQTLMTMAEVWRFYHDDLVAAEQQTKRSLDSKTHLVNEIAEHLLLSGGKRIRPLLMILVSKLGGYSGSESTLLAGVVEFIHTATLLHDDVIDNAEIRRGKRAARFLWGNKASILVGDYLYSRAMCQAVSLNNLEVNATLAEACRRMTEGEVLQLSLNGSLKISEEDYLRIVEYKTAILISATCRLGAIIGDMNHSNKDHLTAFGLHLGIAFQVADDTLDYVADGEKLGKSLGKDIREGKITLPLLHLLKTCPQSERFKIEQMIQSEKGILEDDLEMILNLMKECGSISYSMDRARDFVERAKTNLHHFPDSVSRQALLTLADYIVDRDY